MNFFNKILIENFRNFENFQINFSNETNILIGPNGSGKTNILEVISLFEKGRGFRKDYLINMINKNNKEKMFNINSIFMTEENSINLNLYSEMCENKLKKYLLINGSKSSESLKYFNNLFSIIWFLPEMERLFVESPSLRRNFFDRLIYSVNKDYLNLINKYKKKIIERNNILKNNLYDKEWIQQLESEIVTFGLEIYSKRNKHLDLLNNELSLLASNNQKAHSLKLYIIDNLFNENIDIKDIQERYLLNLKNSRKFDSIIGGCKIGPHKSNINGIQLDKNLNLSFCSTGQQKATVIMIILAQCNYLINSLNRQPIILFDEICSHIDEQNRGVLLDLINSIDVQIFMTGTEKDSFSFLPTNVNYHYIN